MLGPVVTALTNERNLLTQQFVVVAAVGRMAGHAVFLHRRMLVHVRAAFFGVAVVAELVDGVGLDHFGSEAAMGIMAIRAGDLALLDGVMRLAVCFRADIPVAGETEFGLGHLQVLAKIGMAGMATIAGQTSGFVLAALPESHML